LEPTLPEDLGRRFAEGVLTAELGRVRKTEETRVGKPAMGGPEGDEAAGRIGTRSPEERGQPGMAKGGFPSSPKLSIWAYLSKRAKLFSNFERNVCSLQKEGKWERKLGFPVVTAFDNVVNRSF
jgi:hypothetical protein